MDCPLPQPRSWSAIAATTKNNDSTVHPSQAPPDNQNQGAISSLVDQCSALSIVNENSSHPSARDNQKQISTAQSSHAPRNQKKAPRSDQNKNTARPTDAPKQDHRNQPLRHPPPPPPSSHPPRTQHAGKQRKNNSKGRGIEQWAQQTVVVAPLAAIEMKQFPFHKRYTRDISNNALRRQRRPPPASQSVAQSKGQWTASVLQCDDFYSESDLQFVLQSAHESQYGQFEIGWYTSKLFWHWDYEKDAYADLNLCDSIESGNYATQMVRQKLERLTGERITNWSTNGMLGAFHYKTGDAEVSSIHHHWSDGELWSGWVGVLFLSESKDCAGEGTMFFRNKETGLGVTAEFGMDYPTAPGLEAYDMIHTVECKTNRLLLFREAVWHQAPSGWGSDQHDARLFQTFFFETSKQ